MNHFLIFAKASQVLPKISSLPIKCANFQQAAVAM